MSALAFAEPLPGLAPHTDYLLEAVDGAPGLFSLCPPGDPAIRLFVLDAAVYVPGYSPDIAAQAARIGLGEQERPRILVVATPAGGATTVNLAAPVLVNEVDGRAVQAVLDGWPVRAGLGAQ